MIGQVVPLISMSNATDYNYWADLGLKGGLITIGMLCILFAFYKGKISGVSFGPSEAGIREFFGIRLWRIGPGLHPDIDGIWKARKTSVARTKVKFESEFSSDERALTWQYELAVHIRVINTREALIAQIYNAKDTDRENMENSEAEQQATDILERNTRVLLEIGMRASNVEAQLAGMSYVELLSEYGYIVETTKVLKLVVRPQDKLAQAIQDSGSSSAIAAAIEEYFDRPRPRAVAG